MNKLHAIDRLLPHGPEALALNAVTDFEPGKRARARLKVTPALVLYDKELEGVPSWGGIEIMAQALGVYAALDGGCADKRPAPGYLVGVRRYRAARPLLENGLDLDIEAECCQCAAYGLAHFNCSINHDATPLVSAALSVWRPRPEGTES